MKPSIAAASQQRMAAQRRFRALQRLTIVSTLAIAASAYVYCFTGALAQPSKDELASACVGLTGRTTAAAEIALPTRGATINSAEIAKLALPAGAGEPAEYCKVMAAIAPVDPNAYPINVEINLPLAWNGRAVQYGGGGFNGVLITGLAPLRDQPLDLPPPVGRGFMTFGTDSGHLAKDLPEIQAFTLNDEALENFAYAAYKKTHDLAVVVATAFYHRPPERMYYFGGSEGGREGLVMAQRFPADYDGIVSVVPVINWTALQAAGNRSGIMQQNGGWLSPAKVKLLHNAVLAACDGDDGLVDGIISNYSACAAKFDPDKLRCPDGNDGDACLSEAQVKAVKTLHQPYQFGFALANGVHSYPAWNYGGEANPDAMVAWVMGPKPAQYPLPAPQEQGRQWYYGSGAIRYFVARDSKFNSLNFKPDDFRQRVLEISALMDATDPDLSRFAARGGKLIIKENAADFAQSPNAGIDYYKSVVATVGDASVDRFMRLYVTAGVNHAGIGATNEGAPVPYAVDLLGVLEAWVERAHAPGTLVQIAQTAAAPFNTIATRPMCLYPAYPHFKRGSGSQDGSFDCAAKEGPVRAMQQR